MTLSIIVPVLNEAASINGFLQKLTAISNPNIEIIVVDGGSIDGTLSLVAQYDVILLESTKGRAKQMNTGAAKAAGDVLLFVHSDSQFSAVIEQLTVVQRESNTGQWGFFKIKLSGQHWTYRIIETMINLRSCITGVATGDQCIFVNRTLFKRVKGYKDIPLMEDVELSKRLVQVSRPYVVKKIITTSSRRWEKNGIITTVLLMWRLRFLFFIGVSPKRLAKKYLS